MKITLNEWGGCESTECVFHKECAQHVTAGEFRSESGFAPIIIIENCVTADSEVDASYSYGTMPVDVDMLDQGFNEAYAR